MSHRIGNWKMVSSNTGTYCSGYTPMLIGNSGLEVNHRIFPEDFVLKELLLDAYQLTNPSNNDIVYPFLPDGCVTIVFSFGDSSSFAHICGPITTGRKLSIARHSTLFCLRLQPGAADWLDNSPANEITDDIVPLDTYLNSTDSFLHLLKHAESFHERIVFALRILNGMNAATYRRMPLLAHCTNIIQQRQGAVRVSEIAANAGCCGRYLDVLFQTRVGLSTKMYCDIARFQYSLREIIETKPSTILRTAVSHGYFDQAHMNRNYKKFAGCTASAMRCADSDAIAHMELPSIQFSEPGGNGKWRTSII